MKILSTPLRAVKSKRSFASRACLFILLTLVTLSGNLFAHTVDYFTTCGYVCAGSTFTANAHVSAVNSTSRYNWQYKDNSNVWKCFVNGSNTINGGVYTVSGATASGQLTNGPVLTIPNAGTSLNNVSIRLLIADGASPCTASTTWGQDKSLIIHVLTGTDCANLQNYCGGGEQCLKSCTNDARVGAKTTWTINRAAGTVTIRVTLAKTFVDNTYGDNTIGWPAGNHKFNHLVTSDALQLALYNGSNSKVLEFRMDYFSVNSTQPSGYGTTGVTSNDGSMLLGSSSNVVDVRTSLDENFNTYGYVLTTSSPATDASYKVNPSYPNWIYDVWYEATVKLSAFGAAGFGSAVVPSLHASPSKTGNDTECLTDDPTCGTPSTLNLGNLVWNDINANGLKDANEPGVGGVSVKLYRDDNADNIPDAAAIATTTTSTLGLYNFGNLIAGKYIVGITIPTGYTKAPTTTTSATPNNDVDNDNNGVTQVGNELRTKYITLSAGGEPTNDGDGNNGNLSLDLAICGSASLGDFVWSDLNNDGIQNTGEPGIPNITVTLTFPDGTVRTTTTDANGKYLFTALGPVTYKVCFSTPAGYSASPSNVGTNDAIDSDPVAGCVTTITLSPNQVNLTVDAGFNNGKLSLGNLVWNDWNGNGLKEPGEPGVGGVTVRLYLDANANNVVDGAPIATTTTDENGEYIFSNLAPNKYIVGIIIPSGYTITGTSFATPNNDVDNDNNGVNVINQSELRTNYITLTVGGEPGNDGDGANSNLTLDLAICGRSDIGDFVYYDWNCDGIQNTGEPGIADVDVTLTFPDGTTTTTTTDAAGKYFFRNLGPGVHRVTFETPAGYSPVAANQGGDDAKDSDPTNGFVDVTVAAVVDNFTIDAGFCKPGINNLGNLVWNDWNGNGVRDAGEPGVGEVTVRLYRDNNGDNIVDGAPIATTTTSSLGIYNFSGLVDGKYIVGIVIPSGYTITGTSFSNPNNDVDNDNNGVTVINQSELRTNYITLVAGTEPTNDGDGNNGNLTLDLAICGRGSLGDFVWDDLNANGIQDAGEPGIPGVTVTLTFPDGVTTTTKVTDANGKYLFINLGPGTHKVTFSTPAGYTSSPSNQGTNDALDSDPVNGSVLVTLDPQEDDLTIDAGFTRGTGNLNLGNFVWNDFDGDGKKDPNEPAIGGITVSLYRDDNSDNLPDGPAIKTTQTSSLGFYSFTGLTPGRYIASIPIIAGYQQSGNTSTQATSPFPDNDIDNDNNAVRLVGPNGVGGVVYTNAITLTAGGEPTNDGDGSNGNLTLDLALCGNSWIGDFVWDDLNGNGIQDAGEPGINGVLVTLTQPDGTFRTVTTYTDAVKGDGYYDFPRNGPGTYTVTFTTPAGYSPSPANQGPNDALDSDPIDGVVSGIVLLPNQSNFTIDAGFIAPGNNILGNLVWNDTNGNGIRDADEPGVGGATVRLYRDNDGNNIADGAPIATTTTSAAGYYNFSGLIDGKYIVGVVIPSGYTISPTHFDNPNDNVDNDNNGTNVINQAELRSNYITLVAGTEPTNDGDDANGNLTLDIAVCGRSTIGDFVWFDYNNNGIQNTGEPGFPNVKVTITYQDGTTKTVKTDANGNYYFINLGPGTYPIRFTTPLGFTTSPANQGGDDAKDSDPINGLVTVTVGPVESNLTIDAGLWDDVDRDDDGISNLDESGGFYPLRDCDDDGIPNYKDPTPGCPGLTWTDCNGDGINDFFDFDLDGVINELDLDSDNDGILDIVEARDPRMVDANKDGMVDGGDVDGDGLKTSADTNDNLYGGPGLKPEDLDRDGHPNFLDLDSDGDGLSDITEALEAFDADGLANGEDTDGDGVREDGGFFNFDSNGDNFRGMGAKGILVKDRDSDGKPNPYDVDSDNDGITDNVEGQPTCSYKEPSGNDIDKDGIDDVYDTNIDFCVPKGAGVTPYDKDADGTPDIYDLDTDNDGAPDVNEGSGISGNFVTNFADTDGDGLIDQFDIYNIKTATVEFWRNVVHSNMGNNGTFNGPIPAGSKATVPGFTCPLDRDWRSITTLPVTLVDFKGNLNGSTVKLTWTVVNEINMSYYIVERSLNGTTFSDAGKLNALGNSTVSTDYALNDNISSFSGNVYYRLKQVDKNGVVKYSNVIVFKLNGKNNGLTVNPNPAQSFFVLKVNAAKDGMASVKIVDMLGKVMTTETHRVSVGSNAISFNELGKYASGTYTIQVIIDGEVMTSKLVVAK